MIRFLNCHHFFKVFTEFIKSHKLLLTILLIGFIVRILPVFWGILNDPYESPYHPDEGKVLRSILNFPSIYFSNRTFMGYGTFIQYTLGFFFIPLKLIIHTILGFQDFYTVLIWLLSRFSNVLMGTATIYFTYRLATIIFNERVAILAAALLALSFYHAINSAIITLDVAMSLMLVINFLLCFHAVTTNNLREYFFLGVASGMLIGTKITGGLFLIIPVALTLLQHHYYKANSIPKQILIAQLWKKIIIYISCVIIVFLIYHPHVYLDTVKYIGFFLREKRDWVDRTSVPFWKMMVVWIKSTVTSVGLPVTVLAIIGFIVPKRRNLKFQLALLFFLVEYYGFWRWFIAPRYVITVAPIICIFAANACIYFLKCKSKIMKLIAVGATAGSIGVSLYLCVYGINLRLQDTRSDAAKYIAQNIEEGKSIGVAYVSERYTWKTHRWKYPKIDFRKYEEIDFLSEPEIIILSSYDFNRIISTLNSEKIIDEYALGKEYYNEWYRNSPPSPKMLRFYDNLFDQNRSKYSLMIAFKKDIKVPIEFPPPEIRIYKKNG